MLTPDSTEPPRHGEQESAGVSEGKGPRPARLGWRMTFRRQVLRLAVLLGGIYLVLSILAMTIPEKFLFRPHASSYQDDPSIFKLTTADGVRISAMFLPNPNARYTLLFSHGNGEDMGDVREKLLHLNALGFAVLAYDYAGYGTSEGTPSERHCYADIDAAYEYLTGPLKAPPERIILYGQSIGSGPSVDLAARRPVGGLILESAFTSAFACSPLTSLLPGDAFRNIDKIRSVKCPVLSIHGRRDWVVPLRVGKALFGAAPGPKRCLWISRGSHNDLAAVAGEQIDQALTDFAAWLAQGAR
jgi:fermentation-respiration switch protein FrsA (DUF1100 family)